MLILLSLLLLLSWSNGLRAEDSIPVSPEICVPFSEMQELYKAWEENPVLKDTIKNLEAQKAKLNADREKSEKETWYNEKLKELAEKERDLYKNAYTQQTEITKSAMELAKMSKPKTDWWLYVPIVGLVVVAVVAVLAL